MIVALPRNPARYVRLAQSLLDAVPGSWERISASLQVAAGGVERCTVAAACGDTVEADAECLESTRYALAEVARASLFPDAAVWVGIWVEYDVPADRLAVTIMNGGPAPTGPLAIIPPDLHPAGPPWM